MKKLISIPLLLVLSRVAAFGLATPCTLYMTIYNADNCPQTIRLHLATNNVDAASELQNWVISPGATQTYSQYFSGSGSDVEFNIWNNTVTVKYFGPGENIYGTIGAAGTCTTNACTATNYTFTFTLNNNSDVGQWYQAVQDGTPLCGPLAKPGNGFNGTWAALDPGQTATITFNAEVGCSWGTTNVTLYRLNPGQWSLSSCDNNSSHSYVSSDGGYSPSGAQGSWVSNNGGGSGGSNATNVISGTPPSTYGTNNSSPITFPTNGMPADNAAMQQGFDALYDATTKGFADTSTRLQQLHNDNTTIEGALYIETNLVGQVGANVLGASNAVNQSRVDITNRLAGLSNVTWTVWQSNILWQAAISNAVVQSSLVTTSWLATVNASVLSNLFTTQIAISNQAVTMTNSLANMTLSLSNGNAYWSGQVIGTMGSNTISLELSNAMVGSAIIQAISNLSTVFGTNGIVGGTNIFNDSGITNAVDSFHADNTNYLQQMLGALTNWQGSNAVDWFNSSTTNYSSASAAAQAQLGTALGQMDANAQSLSGAGGGYADDGGAPNMTVAVGQWQMDLNPLSNAGIAGVFAMAKRFLAWVLVALFLGKVVHDSYKIIDSLGRIRGQNVQNLDTAGFNIAGALLALVLPIVFLVGWAVVLAVALTWPFGALDVFGTYTSNPLSGGNSISLSLFGAFFPMQLCFSLINAYLVWRISCTKALLIYAAAARFLIGG
jgi:hypothetical protein